jgi:acetoin utilization deacetylase AcuC-like enzyme
MTSMLLYDPEFLNHNAGPGHPERPERLEAVAAGLVPLPAGARMRAPKRPATEEELARVHHPRYIEAILALRGKSARLDEDTAVSPGSVDAALLAAGACLELTLDVLDGTVENGFALVRPPGHHALAEQAMGFCIFNNVAVAAAAAIAKGISRVLIVDWDVHHGNGTQDIFYDRRDVLFFSTHQFPFYPGSGDVTETGKGKGEGYTINVPLRAGLSDADYVHAFKEILVPAAEAYRPELVLVSAGFDAYDGDPLASMCLSSNGFSALCGIVRDIADKWAQGRIVLALEGGYALTPLAKSVRACTEVLGGGTPAAIVSEPSSAGREDVQRAKQAVRL